LYADCECEGSTDANFCPGLNLNIGDACNDGDACTGNDIVNEDCNCIGTIIDSDLDGICDAEDNCPDTANENQADNDNDNMGDSCDLDDDNDGVADADDNCDLVSNPNQEDLDNDGIGDACDDDVDGDNIDNEMDNCPFVSNANQLDTDDDGKGNACDLDDDNDGVDDSEDNCPLTSNPDQSDVDGDGIGDVCDFVAVKDDLLQYVIYPNPTIQSLTIELEGEFNAKLYGVDGSLIYQGIGTNKKFIDVSAYNTGIYFLHLESNGKIANEKIIKL